MLVYRDARRSVELGARATELRRTLASGDALAILLGAGEIEAALLDVGGPDASRFAALTDSAARALVTGVRFPAEEWPSAWSVPALTMPVSVPEGFAYYDVHPSDYSRAALAAVPAGSPVWVVGIRTIGTVLSAMVLAALRGAGHEALRSSVRLKGHPFDRRLEVEPELTRLARWAARRGACVVVVDEGPGISGSSFLAVADALVASGVPRSSLLIIGSRVFDPARLVARDAAVRFASLRRVVAGPDGGRPANAGDDLSAGAWRKLLYVDRDWPPVWPQAERRKYLSADGREILKFEGLGRYGDVVRGRSELLASQGLGPPVRSVGEGYAAYQRIAGRPMQRADPPPLESLVRLSVLRPMIPEQDVSLEQLGHMVRTNVEELTGRAIRVELELERAIIADGRLSPHEWIIDRDRVMKTDSGAHGDDHFYPGPCDVAWDLAGAIVEWDLDADHAEALLSSYARQSGDLKVRERMPGWTQAYLAFRAAYFAMGRDASAHTPEHAGLAREASRLRRLLCRAQERTGR